MIPRNILILEDNKNHMAALLKIIHDLHKEVKPYCAKTAGEAVQLAFEYHIHLFLVDIVLDTKKPGDVSGLDFVKQIREISRYKFTPLIFITSLEDPTIFAYKQLHCYDYIEKPFDPKEVKKVILETLEYPVREDDDKFTYFQSDRISYSVYLKDIVYIETSRKKVKIFFSDHVMEFSYITSGEILRKLDSPSFIRSNRNYIVNKKYIEYVDKVNLFVKLKHYERPIDIGPVMKKSFLDRIGDE